MRDRTLVVLVVFWAGLVAPIRSAPVGKTAACQAGVIEGELKAGEEFTRPIGNGLRLWFQPIASGWILRVVPATGPVGEHDYAELATPPYQSVTPLSLSTDFAFRAQDAVGWNPRRFKFASSLADFDRLNEVYQQFVTAGASPPAPLEVQLSEQIQRASDGKLTIIDAKLVPGTGDQWRMAGAVSSRFAETAHTLVNSADQQVSPLGKLVWVRFRVELDLPTGFRADRDLRIVPHLCGNL
jgi:hypothetical protein